MHLVDKSSDANEKKWDARFLDLATFVAQWSKDPSTKVGAVIVDDKRRIIALGYNGFPRGVDDDPKLYADRTTKYPMVVHAELNAILNALGPVEGCTLYVTPLSPCSECAKAIIQAGIHRLVISRQAAAGADRWGDSTKIGWMMMDEAGLNVGYLGDEVGLKDD